MDRISTILISLLTASLLILGASPATVRAHTVEESESVNVTMHVEPDHSPIAGEEAGIIVGLSDYEWSLNDCDCWLFINDSQGNQLHAISFLANGVINRVDYTFEEPGEYKLVVTGQPWPNLDFHLFEPFSAEFTTEVLPEPSFLARHGAAIALNLVLLGAAVWAILILLKKLRQTKQSK